MLTTNNLPALGAVAQRTRLVLSWPNATAPAYHHFKAGFIGSRK
jgi:hypothetical protein